MGAVSAILMLAMYRIIGFEDDFQGIYMLLVFPEMMVIAYSQSVIYYSAKKLLYDRLLRPILEDL